MTSFTMRRAAIADVPALEETQHQGFKSYKAFTPRGWAPPDRTLEAAAIRDRLSQPSAWCVIAHAGDEPAGHVGFVAAREGMAHVWALFVRRPYWGSGLARRLHAMALAEATARGYGVMRLYTPAGQARARAFYEREGWTTDGVVWFEPMLALDLVEYRRGLPGSEADAAPA